MKDFLRQAKIIKKIYFIIFLLAVLVVHLFVVTIFSDQVITLSRAYDVILFSQEITPMDPVKAYEELEKSMSQNSVVSKGSSYRVMVDLENIEKKESLVVSPITTFAGEAAYPNSRILLEISSDTFITSALTDSDGKWIWSNHSHPLGDGNHVIRTYNISPFEISGVKDVFVQEYSFSVEEVLEKKETSIVNLSELAHSHVNKEDEDLLKDIINENIDNVYFFDTIILNKKNYFKGDHVKLQISMESLGGATKNNGAITYEIFEDDGLNGRKVSEFKDEVIIEKSDSFLKKIELKDKMLSGNFFLKTTLDASGRKYVSINNFSVTSEEILKAGEVVVTKEHVVRILLNSIALILLIIIMILLIMIFEYKRFMKEGDVGKEFMRKKGYLNN